MRLLAFYPYVPYPLDRGAYYRAFYLLRGLGRDHEVDLLALTENGEGVPHQSVFEEFCRDVEIVPFTHPGWEKLFPKRLFNPLPSTVAHWTLPQAAAALERRMSQVAYDAVHIFDIVLAQYFLNAHVAVPLIVDRTRVDLQYQIMAHRRMRSGGKRRLLHLENLAKLWWYERRVARRTKWQVVCGPDDEAFIRRYVDRSVPLAVIPNGVDTTFFHPGAGDDEPRSVHPAILFCGAMDYNPNVDALRWYFEELHASLVDAFPDLRLWIVGKDPVPEVKAYGALPNVIVTGAVADVRPYYRRAWLQIVPLRIGGGTRLKIVESMAMGTSVVSTTIGAQGLDLRHEHDVLLADTAGAFIEQTARALRDSHLRLSLETAGLGTVQRRLSWPMLGRQLSELYSSRLSRTTLPAQDVRCLVDCGIQQPLKPSQT